MANRLTLFGIIVAKDTSAGTDYSRFCTEHKWCSLDSTNINDIEHCPECMAKIDSGRGHRRYEQLQAELLAQEEADRQTREYGLEPKEGLREAMKRHGY